MFLHNGKPRRKPLVYGKARRTTPAYIAFEEDDAVVMETQCSSSSSGHDEDELEQPRIRGQVVKSIQSSPKTKLNHLPRRTLSGQKPIYRGITSQEVTGPVNGAKQSPSTFDFPSSEEEGGTIAYQKSVQKRRRLTPVRNGGTTGKPDQEEPRRSNQGVDIIRDSRHLRTGKERGRAKIETKPLPITTQQIWQKARTPSSERYECIASASLCSTPNQTRLLSGLLDAADPTGSPSNLPITSLRLTNTERKNAHLLRQNSRSPVNAKQVQGHLLQSKKRLIDAMASPVKRLSVSKCPEACSESSTLDAVSETETKKDSESVEVEVANVNQVSRLTKSEHQISNKSFTAPMVTLKSRVTYSRERSHLADMIFDDVLDSDNLSASQESNQLASQNSSIFSTFDAVTPYEPIEEDLEQDTAGIRSIHELRHSGSNARSRVDLESIFEDVAAPGLLARTRRLRGLSQLTEKLEKPEIGRQILEQGLDLRLIRCPLSAGDVVGHTLLTMSLCRLMVCVQLPITSLRRILEVVYSSGTTVLQWAGDFVKTVRYRKQNLSKATCRDIISLSEPFCSSPVWPDRCPKSFSPRLVFIRCLDITLRQIRRLGDFSTILPASIFNELVQFLLLFDPAGLDDEQDEDSVLVMQMTVSVIESLTLSRNWAEDECFGVAKQLSGLGPLLSQLTGSGSESASRTHHLILRLILNITNNDSELCETFTEPRLLKAIFDIVRRGFIQTPLLTNTVVKESRLEGIILALGALSNLAEHSNRFRRTMLEMTVDNQSMVDWVAYAFREQVGRASDASSVEQTTSLVAFGYLSVLLCNLCMDDPIRLHVRKLLTGGTLQPLLLFVCEFLNHFRRAEELESKSEESDDRKVKSHFVDRFEGVLEALQQAERDS